MISNQAMQKWYLIMYDSYMTAYKSRISHVAAYKEMGMVKKYKELLYTIDEIRCGLFYCLGQIKNLRGESK